MNTLKEFDPLLTKAQNLAFEQKRKSLDTIYTRFTREGDVSEEDYRDVDTAGFGLAGFTPEGGSNHRDTYKVGNEIVVKFKKYTISLISPEEIRKALLSNGRVKKDKAKRFARIAPDMAESMNKTREYITADYVLRGNSTTVTPTWAGTFRDGLALASTSHTLLKSGSTWSNLQTGSAMTQLSLLDGLAMLANTPDENGFPQGAVGDVYLLHGPWNQFRVTELLQTPTTPNTSGDLTVNPLARKRERMGNIIPILNPYLGDTFTGWALIDATNHMLFRFEKEPPTFSTDIDINNGNKIDRCMMRYAINPSSAKGYVLNPGV